MWEDDLLNSNNSSNPTDYTNREKKAHYDDTLWILDKAAELNGQEEYMDVYGYAFTPVN